MREDWNDKRDTSRAYAASSRESITAKTIQDEINRILGGPFSMSAVRDLSSLYTVLDHLEDGVNLDTRPTLDQIEKALNAVALKDEADAKRKGDYQTWVAILRNG